MGCGPLESNGSWTSTECAWPILADNGRRNPHWIIPHNEQNPTAGATDSRRIHFIAFHCISLHFIAFHCDTFNQWRNPRRSFPIGQWETPLDADRQSAPAGSQSSTILPPNRVKFANSFRRAWKYANQSPISWWEMLKTLNCVGNVNCWLGSSYLAIKENGAETRTFPATIGAGSVKSSQSNHSPITVQSQSNHSPINTQSTPNQHRIGSRFTGDTPTQKEIGELYANQLHNNLPLPGRSAGRKIGNAGASNASTWWMNRVNWLELTWIELSTRIMATWTPLHNNSLATYADVCKFFRKSHEWLNWKPLLTPLAVSRFPVIYNLRHEWRKRETNKRERKREKCDKIHANSTDENDDGFSRRNQITRSQKTWTNQQINNNNGKYASQVRRI